MDVAEMIEAMLAASASARKPYHLSLGALEDAAAEDEGATFEFDIGGGIAKPHSYRGYYDELAFERSDKPTTANEVYELCRKAAIDTFEGYKGGSYNYDADTPLWCASYGLTGRAITGMTRVDDRFILTTKEADL